MRNRAVVPCGFEALGQMSARAWTFLVDSGPGPDTFPGTFNRNVQALAVAFSIEQSHISSSAQALVSQAVTPVLEQGHG